MSEQPEHHDLWRWPTFLLWLLFFAIGFVPEYFYALLREWGYVVSQHAFVNSPFMLTFGQSMYISFFVYFRCREAGCEASDARSKAVQTLIFALLAFFPLISLSVQFQDIPLFSLRQVVLWTTFAKWLAWLYLYVMVIRYYFFDGQNAMRNMRLLFPSAMLESETSVGDSGEEVKRATVDPGKD